MGASKLALLACGLFFLTSLFTGVWKYLAIYRSPTLVALRYVSVAHQASLLYSFAALVLFQLLKFSPYTETINLLAVGVPLLFFSLAIAIYIAHGFFRIQITNFNHPIGSARS